MLCYFFSMFGLHKTLCPVWGVNGIPHFPIPVVCFSLSFLLPETGVVKPENKTGCLMLRTHPFRTFANRVCLGSNELSIFF